MYSVHHKHTGCTKVENILALWYLFSASRESLTCYSITFFCVAEGLPVASSWGGDLVASLQLIYQPQRHLVVQVYGHPGGGLGINLTQVGDGFHVVPQGMHVPREPVLLLWSTDVKQELILRQVVKWVEHIRWHHSTYYGSVWHTFLTCLLPIPLVWATFNMNCIMHTYYMY